MEFSFHLSLPTQTSENSVNHAALASVGTQAEPLPQSLTAYDRFSIESCQNSMAAISATSVPNTKCQMRSCDAIP